MYGEHTQLEVGDYIEYEGFADINAEDERATELFAEGINDFVSQLDHIRIDIAEINHDSGRVFGSMIVGLNGLGDNLEVDFASLEGPGGYFYKSNIEIGNTLPDDSFSYGFGDSAVMGIEKRDFSGKTREVFKTVATRDPSSSFLPPGDFVQERYYDVGTGMLLELRFVGTTNEPVVGLDFGIKATDFSMESMGIGGCLIATATYGTELAPQVQLLREIRDGTLMSTESGSAFLAGFHDIYYSFSPAISDMEREYPIFREAVKTSITPMLSTLPIMSLADEGSELQVVGLGLSVIALNVGMYIAAPAAAVTFWRRRRQTS